MMRHLPPRAAALTAFLTLASATATVATATSVVPFPSLGDLLDASPLAVTGVVVGTYEATDGEATYYGYELRITEAAKLSGGVEPGQTVRLHAGTVYEFADGSLMPVTPLFELASGTTYTLFLREGAGGWTPVTGALGVYAHLYDPLGGEYAVPVGAGEAFVLPHPSGRAVEPQRVYTPGKLLDRLRARLVDASLRVEDAATELAPEAFATQAAMAPAQCNSFTDNFSAGTLPIRWPTTAITIYHNATNPSVGSTNAHALVQQMVASLNANYPLNLTYGGVTPVGGNQCIADARAAGGGTSITIAFANTSVCMQTGLNGCSGTLGIGGPSYNSLVNTSPRGDQYYTITTGGVVIDQGAACVGESGYVRLLEHEVTHALGFDHITAGSANMNPSCCINITALDQECLEFVYGAAPLPVELVSLSAKPVGRTTQLEWATATESNSASFAVERSRDGRAFETIGEVGAAGASVRVIEYRFTDGAPAAGTNYYRLRQRDLDGTETLSNVISTSFGTHNHAAPTVRPNPITNQFWLDIPELQQAGTVSVQLFAADGRSVYQRLHLEDGGNLSLYHQLPDLPGGVYSLVVHYDGQRYVERLAIR